MGTVRDVMTAEPIVLQRDQSIADAARAMRDHAVGSVLGDGDKLYGLVTDRDIVVRAAGGIGAARFAGRLPCAARIWSRSTPATTPPRRCG